MDIEKKEYDALIADREKLTALENTNTDLKTQVETLKGEISDLQSVVNESVKYKKDQEEIAAKALDTEAEDYISSQIAEGKVMPASKNLYIEQYKTFKAAGDDKLNVFKKDIEDRDKLIFEGALKEGTPAGKATWKNNDEFLEVINKRMKAEKIDFDKARELVLAEADQEV